MKDACKSLACVAGGFIIFMMLIGFSVPRGARMDMATIQISSDTSWNGTISVDAQNMTAYGSGSKSYRVTGENYQLMGSNIVATIQKETEGGFLTVSIIFNGQTKASQRTTATFGVVTVSWTF